jgi:hypothetical protein
MEPPADQLKLLSDYTLFHIGLYTTLVSTLIALAHFRRAKVQGALYVVLVCTVICFIVAGAAGGVIASNIPNFSTFASYDGANLEVFGRATMPYRLWAHVEHGAFWVGLVIAAVGFLSL